ncbi:hypothetical protein EJB05_14143, partial [Eragrostis curvula]
MGEIAFLVDRYSKMTTTTMKDKRLHNLERLLLQVSIIIEEAEGRHITNKAIIHQLNLLRKEMYSGFFIMDSLRRQKTDVEGHDVSHSFALSKFNPAKRIFFTSIDTYGDEDLQQVLDNLNNIIEDTYGLVMFLKNHPPLYRQPYSMHLYISRCMFGRQVEMERIMDFLMQKDHQVTESVGILPIVGPRWVGKSTIIAHVCNDAKVRDYFSQVMIFTGDDTNNENIYTMRDVGVTMHRNDALVENEKVLVIVELSGDIDEVAWTIFFSSYGVHLGKGSRIIMTSRSDQVKKIGTTQALVLDYLPPDAYWYFFKVLTFGSVFPSDQPELESIAMEIARGLDGTFISANMISRILRNNFVSQHWRVYLECFNTNIQHNVSLFGESPYNLTRKSKPRAYHIKNDWFAVFSKHRTCPDGQNIPRIKVRDVLSGNIKHEGEFDVFVCKSCIPPYSSYIVSCTIEKLNHNKKMKMN